jgi:hypothetical protein
MRAQTIGAEVQEVILNVLPSDYDRAMALMCQLLANIALSGDKPWPIEKVLSEVSWQYSQYKGD